MRRRLFPLIILLTILFLFAPTRSYAEDQPSQAQNGDGTTAEQQDEDDGTDTPSEVPDFYYFQAKVLRVETITALQDSSLSYDETKQIVTVEITQGEFKSRVYDNIENYIRASDPKQIMLKEGDVVMVAAELTEDSQNIKTINISDFYRINKLLLFFLATIAIVAGVGWIKGLKAFVSIAAIGVCIVFFFIPLMLKGFSPIVLMIPICLVAAGINIFWELGIGIRGISAMLGFFAGVLSAGIAGLLMEKSAKLVGLGESELSMLLYMSDHTPLNYTGLMFATSMLIASGGIVDICLGCLEEMYIVRESNPYISKLRLFTYGLKRGQIYLNRNSLTLFCAIISAILPIIVMYAGFNTSLSQLLNMDIVATQLFRLMSAVIGAAISIPATCYIFTFISKKKSLY